MKEIIKGISNHYTDNKVELSEQRMKICRKCEHIKEHFLGEQCGKCGCILKFKTKSDSSCPVGKW